MGDAFAGDGLAERLDPLAMGIAPGVEQRDLEELPRAHVLGEARQPRFARFEPASEFHHEDQSGFAKRIEAGFVQVVISRQAGRRVDGRLAPAFEKFAVKMMRFAAHEMTADAMADELGNRYRSDRSCDRLGHVRILTARWGLARRFRYWSGARVRSIRSGQRDLRFRPWITQTGAAETKL